MDGNNAKATIIEQPQQKREAKAASKKKLLTRFKITAVVVAILSVSFLIYKQITKPALQIGSTSISKARYKQLVKEAETSKLPNIQAQAQSAKRSYADVIIEAEQYKIIAKELNIDVPEKSIIENASVYYALNGAQPNEWQKEASYKAAFDGALIVAQTATKNIGIYHFGFGRYVDSNELKPTDPKFGKPQEIAKDRAYAETKANEYRSELKQKKISPDVAIKKILADPRLGFGSLGNRSRRVAISDKGFIVKTGGGSSGEFLGPEELNAVNKLKKGELSEVKVKNMMLTAKPGDTQPKYADIGFYFIQLESQNNSRNDLQDQVNDMLKDIKVKKNVKS